MPGKYIVLGGSVAAIITILLATFHFAVVVIINLSLGMITPPYGITLYVASSVANLSVLQVSRKIGLPFALMFAVLILTTFVPELVTYLPDILMPNGLTN